jgi:carbon storage regulator
MLILTRKVNESIRIGADVEVRILGVHGNQVRIGIEAPRAIEVMRTELVGRPRAHAEAPKP